MNVLPSDARQTPAVQAASALRADGTSAGAPRPDSASPPPSAAGDRVELSTEARSQAPPAAASDEVEGARVALRAGQKLSAARLHELREQVRTGHYDSPETIDRIASAAVSDLSGDR